MVHQSRTLPETQKNIPSETGHQYISCQRLRLHLPRIPPAHNAQLQHRLRQIRRQRSPLSSTILMLWLIAPSVSIRYTAVAIRKRRMPQPRPPAVVPAPVARAAARALEPERRGRAPGDGVPPASPAARRGGRGGGSRAAGWSGSGPTPPAGRSGAPAPGRRPPAARPDGARECRRTWSTASRARGPMRKRAAMA